MGEDQPLLPDYGGACISNVARLLLEPPEVLPPWMPAEAVADQVVLLVVDGLGWNQFERHRDRLPSLSSMAGGPITSVAPSTTASALTSISIGVPPGEHGVVGYRMSIDSRILNVLRWNCDGRDARTSIPPEKIQPTVAFQGQHPVVVSRAEFIESGFTRVHMGGVRFCGYRMPSTLVSETARLLREGEPFVYAYYEGVDKVAHEYGLGAQYQAELKAVDQMVMFLREALPAGASLVVISDHGQVDVGDDIVKLHPDVMDHVSHQSGEGRFRWLHARPGRSRALAEAARLHHSDRGWVVPQAQVVEEGWLGSVVSDGARARLGDVALVARDDIAYHDPADTGPFELVARHGSLTAEEMLVPLLAARH